MSGTEKHIDFNEMVEFINESEYNDDFRRRAAAINAHLYGCPDCRKRYEAVGKIIEIVKNLPAKSNLSEMNKYTIKALELLQVQSGVAAKVKMIKEIITVTIYDNREIRAADSDRRFNFVHPDHVYAAAKSAGGAPVRKPVRSALKSGNNYIKTSRDGDLSFKLSEEIYPADSTVYLTSNDEYGEIIQSAVVERSEEGGIRILFREVKPGKYAVVSAE